MLFDVIEHISDDVELLSKHPIRFPAVIYLTSRYDNNIVDMV